MKMTHQVNGSAIVIDGLGQPDIQTAKADAIAKSYSPTQDSTSPCGILTIRQDGRMPVLADDSDCCICDVTRTECCAALRH